MGRIGGTGGGWGGVVRCAFGDGGDRSRFRWGNGKKKGKGKGSDRQGLVGSPVSRARAGGHPQVY